MKRGGGWLLTAHCSLVAPCSLHIHIHNIYICVCVCVWMSVYMSCLCVLPWGGVVMCGVVWMLLCCYAAMLLWWCRADVFSRYEHLIRDEVLIELPRIMQEVRQQPGKARISSPSPLSPLRY